MTTKSHTCMLLVETKSLSQAVFNWVSKLILQLLWVCIALLVLVSVLWHFNQKLLYCIINNVPDGWRLYFLGLIKVTNWLLATKIANTKSCREKQCRLIHRLRAVPLSQLSPTSRKQKKTLASGKWPREIWGEISRGHFPLTNVFSFLARQTKLGKRNCLWCS